MTASKKLRVAVLYGGRSAEHEVSLQSAANVISNLDASQFDVVPIGIDKQGRWFLGQDVFVKSLAHQAVPQLSQEWFAPHAIARPIQQKEAISPAFDVVFPAVHGTFCEDGTLQGLMELAEIPFVGCGVLSSAINMDKDISKRLAKAAGIGVVPFVVAKIDRWDRQAELVKQEVQEKLGYPVFVKPANTGSSIGVSKVKSPDGLAQAVKEAFQFDTKVIIEKALNVRELEIAVLESLVPNEGPIVSIVGEIKPSHEFYSYEAKYLDEHGASLCIPAELSEEMIESVRSTAASLFQVLECEGMARVDLFLDKDTQQIYFNEINTLPGFTKISMYPKLMAASGVSYGDLLTHLIKLAIKRHQHKQRLHRQLADK